MSHYQGKIMTPLDISALSEQEMQAAQNYIASRLSLFVDAEEAGLKPKSKLHRILRRLVDLIP